MKFITTFGGMIHTVYGANFIGHLISLFIDNPSTVNIRIRLNPKPKQPITIGFISCSFVNNAFKGCEYFVFNKNTCPICNYDLYICFYTYMYYYIDT